MRKMYKISREEYKRDTDTYVCVFFFFLIKIIPNKKKERN